MKTPRNKSKSGQTLVVVLLYLSLLIALALLFLVRSMTALQLSSNSVSGEKASDLALSGGDIVIGDLKQEIIDGSTSSSFGTYNVYLPKPTATGALSTAVPAIAGFTPAITNGIETDGLANLVKLSQNGTPFYSNTANTNYANNGISRASAVNTSIASLDGRVITPARWNSHYLIARPVANQGLGLNSTPVANFPSPDWIIMTRSGAGKAYTAADLPNLSSSTNTQFAVGRFAYTVYNEGGLLDMNAAGYPSSLTPQQVAQKASLAFADLTQLGLTKNQVDQIVGWRNPYTSELGASSQFGSVAFNASTGSNWLNNFVNYNYCQTNSALPSFGQKNGFMTVNTGSIPSGGAGEPQSDQILTSRQQLISLVESLGIGPDVLQYLGTFSRSLEQPSVNPNPNRPHIINPAIPPPTVGGTPNESSYAGNNDAVGGDDTINPSFLKIRVTSSFPRLNGATAHVGEPLVISRFSLNNLAMVAYNATNSALPTGFAATGSDPDPIYDRFGLKRMSVGSPWIYNHGSNSILTLDKVAAAGREPDFAELLKAAINVGALAKGAPNLHPTQSNYEYTIDSTTDYQVLQIMANLIDQQDADSYPTVIQIASGPGGSTTIYGVEDLPYFNRFHVMSIVDQLPNPLCLASDVLTVNPTAAVPVTSTVSQQWSFPAGTASASSFTHTIPIPSTTPWSIDHTVKATLSSPGEVAHLYVPDLWNPHDQNTASSNTALRPTQFRIYAQTTNPVGQGGWQTGMTSIPSGYYPNNIVPQNDGASPPANYYCPASAAQALTQANTELDFSDNAGSLFREPTLLWNSNPTGIALTGVGSPSITDANTGETYFGIVLGKAPISFQYTITSTPANLAVDGTYVTQSTSVTNTQYIPVASGGYAQITFFLQYKDPAGNWITYDTKYPDLHGLSNPTIVTNVADFSNSKYKNPFACNQVSDQASCIDPRSSRWGMGTAANKGQISSGTSGTTAGSAAYLLEPTASANVLNSGNLAANNSMGSCNFSVFETSRPRGDKCNYVNYSNPGMAADPGLSLQMRLFSGVGFSASNGSNASPLFFDGLLSQNNPNAVFQSRNNSVAAQIYFEDADGICRRAMGAYASTAMTDTSTSDLAQSITSSPTRIGLPECTASTFNNNAVATATQQTQSRPIMLNRPFKSVSEMSYAFTGTPWKNIDFFTPESGYAALLDTFCVGQPTAPLIAGKVDLNTRQQPVLKALIAGASRDEWNNLPTPPAYALPPISATEAGLAAQRLVAFTSDTTDSWRGPLSNVSELVGRFVQNMAASPTVITGGALPDWFTYVPPTPASGQVSTASYSGFTALLDSTVYTNTTNSNNLVAPVVQRFKESALRPLADCGQTRVWNLLIDVIAQSGRYPQSATALNQFAVQGEKRLWIHVAIDRYTGQVLDKQVEVVAQ